MEALRKFQVIDFIGMSIRLGLFHVLHLVKVNIDIFVVFFFS